MSKVRSEDGPTAEEVASLIQKPASALNCELKPGDRDDMHVHNSSTRRIWRAVVNGLSFGNASRTKNHLIVIALGIFALVTGSYLAISIMTPDGKRIEYVDDNANGKIHVVLLADAHLIGPQYQPGGESNDVDNDSIMKTGERLREAQRKIESLSPRPAAVVFLGDVIHNGYVSKEFEWYVKNRNAYTVGQEIFGAFTVPVRYLWGNHDYHTTCGNVSKSYNRTELSHRLFRHFLGNTAEPYSSIRLGAFKLIFLNGMLGPSWDPTDPRCDTRLASLGERQLIWLAEELKQGEPTFVFLHHPLTVTLRGEAGPPLEHPDVISMLLAHRSHILAVFSGHYHRGLDWGEAYPFHHRTLPSCRYDSDNWFVLELEANGSSWQLLDWDKNKGGARCSETWEYTAAGGEQGGLQARRTEPQPAENGTCGHPTLEQEDQVVLPPLKEAADVPGPSQSDRPEAGPQFNPERPCSLRFQPAFLDLCSKEGATEGCCAILGTHLRASSAAYGASCMCLPAFWHQAQQLFNDTQRNVTEVLQSCAKDHGAELQWPGRAGGSCLTGSTPMLPPATEAS